MQSKEDRLEETKKMWRLNAKWDSGAEKDIRGKPGKHQPVVQSVVSMLIA